MDRGNSERPIPTGRGANSDALLTPTEQAIQDRLGSRSGRRSQSKFSLPKWLTLVAIVVGIALLAWFFLIRGGSVGGYIDGGKYQAVFFTNGQVYFGKLSPLGDGYLKLSEVFYLQSKDADTTDPQETSNSETNVELIKLGSEVHGPEDAMIVSRDQVLFFENLKRDGTVSKSIEKYKADNKQ